MALSGIVEVETEIKAPAGKFFEIFSSKPHHIANVCPGKIQQVKVHEGDWNTVGSVLNWNYVLDGKAQTAKVRVVAIDDRNKSVTFNLLQGDLMEHYKALKATVQATPKDVGCMVKWSLEYEKKNRDVTTPNHLVDFAVSVSKDIDGHLVSA